MSVYYRTLLESGDDCIEYLVQNGGGAGDTIEVSYIECIGTPNTVTLTTPSAIIIICSSTVPTIDFVIGTGTVTPTGNTC